MHVGTRGKCLLNAQLNRSNNSAQLKYQLGNFNLSSSCCSPGRTSGSFDSETVMMNHVYKERFPKVSRHLKLLFRSPLDVVVVFSKASAFRFELRIISTLQVA